MGDAVMLDARRVLLSGLIDYAGLFPPASLDMAGAVAGYRAARASDHSWMLGRFICPASRLEEMAGVLTMTMRTGEAAWPVSVVLDGEVATAAANTQSFDAHMGNAAEVVLTEVRLPTQTPNAAGYDAAVGSVRTIAQSATSISPTVVAFLEVPRGDGWETGIGTVASAIAIAASDLGRSIGAKFRCGGATADTFPTSEQIARFLVACRQAGVPYKVTAGLHHPIRHHNADIDVWMHGFLNVLAASALSENGADEETMIDALNETDPSAFAVSRARISWRDQTVGVASLVAMRERRFPSYGSCSFDEPVDDLIGLGILSGAQG